MSLYRKYRPQSFGDVSGQEAVVTTLEQAVKQDKIAHAYLFAGPRGTGKTSMARILAKKLLTQGIEDAVLSTQIEKGVEEGTITDLIEIDAASNRGIDDIRSLVEKIQFSPIVGSAKVYIIDEVHMLTREAFNALLKTLEEPPPYAYFILATTELQKVPATIQSRCQRFGFRHIQDDDMIKRLRFIADQETMDIDDAALKAIAHHAQGGLRDAISLLDQLRSLPKIRLPDVEQRVGTIGFEHVTKLFDALASSDADAIVATIDALDEAGVALEAFARELLAEARRELHRKIERKEPIDATVRLLELLLDAVKDMRLSPVPSLALEAALLSAISHTSNQQAVVSGQRNVKEEPVKAASATPPIIRTEVPSPKAQVPIPKSSSTPPSPSPNPQDRSPHSSFLTFESVVSRWHDVVNQATPSSVKMSLKNGRVTTVENGRVTVSFPSAFHRDRVAQTDASTTIERVLQEMFQQPLRLDCVLDQEKSAPPPRSDLVNLAEAAAEIF